MKKKSLLLSLTISTLSIVFLSACQQSDGVEHIDLSRSEEISRKVFEASQSDTILAKHESYAYTWALVGNSNIDDEYHYTDHEWIYKEWSLNKQQLYYQDSRIAVLSDWGNSSMAIGANVKDELTKPKALFLEKFEDFYIPNDDIPTDIYIKNGLLYYESRFTQKYGEEYYQRYMNTSIGDGYVTTRLIANAETYETYELTTTVHKDNKDTLFFEQKVEYDVLPHTGALVCDAFYHRNARRYTNIKIHVNPGSEKAFDIEFDVPTYTEINYLISGTLGTDYVYFYDPDCTTFQRWDRYVDLEVYMFTHPTQEQIDKYKELYDALPPLN